MGCTKSIESTAGVFRETAQVKYAMIKPNENQFSVIMMCRSLSVSRIGYHLYLDGRRLVVLELYSRRILGWAIAERIRQREYVMLSSYGVMVQEETNRRNRPFSVQSVLFSSLSETFRKYHLIGSMSKKGDCYDDDNSMLAPGG